MQGESCMQFLIIFPLCLHLWLIKEKRKQLLIESCLSISLLISTCFINHPCWFGTILLWCFIQDSKRDYFYHLVFIFVLLGTMQRTYYMMWWVGMEIVFLLYRKMFFKSYEQQMQEYQNKIFDRQVQEVENMYTTMRGWRHDYHNHLQNLKAKLKQQEVKESLQYLDELEKELDEIRQLVESGNTNMDAILNSKLSLAFHKKININVKAKVPSQLPINDTDICALLGNLVDNAVEACEQVENNPYIRLYIGQYKGQLYISCTNATKELVRKLDAQYISEKRGNHGHGLKRMNKIVEKYGGLINRKNEPGVFITEILLPM